MSFHTKKGYKPFLYGELRIFYSEYIWKVVGRIHIVIFLVKKFKNRKFCREDDTQSQ